MTQQPRNGDRPPDHYTDPDCDPDQLAMAELANAGVPDVVDGMPPAPINVWRLTDVRPSRARRHDSALTPQLAVLLLGVFTRPGDVVVDVDADPALAGSARAGARRYLPAIRPADVAALPAAPGAARLAVLPWPLPATSSADVADVLAACRRLLTADGRVIVALVPSQAEPPYVEQARAVIPAAGLAGLAYLQHIIVTTASALPSGAETGDEPHVATCDEMTPYLNLLVFGPHGGLP